MKARYWILLVLLSLAACQTTPPTPTPSPTPSATPEPSPTPIPGASAIGVSATGFSPKAGAPHNTITFTLQFASADAVTKWTVVIAGPNGIVKTTNALTVQPTLTWDGSTDGAKLTDGSYRATLTVTRGDAIETVNSSDFVVDVTPPSGTVSVTPQPFTVGSENGGKVTFGLDLKGGGASVATWRLFVIHPDRRRFIDFISENNKDNKVVWDGRDASGNPLETGTTYNIVVQVFDEYGNTGTIYNTLPVTNGAVVAPVTVSLNGALLGQLQVYFPAYSADMDKVDADKAQSNKAALDKLTAMLRASPGSKIRVVGHANQVLWQDPVKAQYEQTETLIPLSKARAEAVLAALKSRGLDPKTFKVNGVGAEGNVVPFSDAENVWKNRRVEFLIDK